MTHQCGLTSFGPGASLRVRNEQTDAHRTVFNADARASRAHSFLHSRLSGVSVSAGKSGSCRARGLRLQKDEEGGSDNGDMGTKGCWGWGWGGGG